MSRVVNAIFAAALVTWPILAATPAAAADACVRIQHMRCLNARVTPNGKVIGHVSLGDKVKTSSCAAWCKIARTRPAYFAAKCPSSTSCAGKPTTKPASGCRAPVVRKGAC